MATFTFRWEHPEANEVYVTGSFDDWAQSLQLDKKGEVFEKTVSLPTDKKILYKFVVDGHWMTDHTKPTETDERNNSNNVLEPSDLQNSSTAEAAIMSNVTPNSTTAALAGKVPKETPKDEAPGAFPETPADEQAGFSVNPIPATGGASNPIKLAPGQKVPDPSSLTSNTVGSTVKTDKESYEKSNAAVASVPPSGATTSDLPPPKNLIPESSLPIGSDAPGGAPSALLNSAGAGSTTAALAGAVPKEGVPIAAASAGPGKDKASAVQASAEGTAPGVPAVVSESISKAHESPEAAANAEAVKEKGQVEAELEKKVDVAEQSGEPAPTAAAGEAGSSTPKDKKSKRKSIFGKIKKIFD